MSDDWKRRLDEKERREAEARRKRLEEEDRRIERKVEEEHRRQEAERERIKNEHYRRFRCHIKGCSRASSGPVKEDYVIPSRADGPSGNNYKPPYYGTRVDWNTPTGLEKCSRCGQWTCSVHIHHGICKECAERMGKGFWERLFG